MVGNDDRKLMGAIGLTIAAWGACYVALGIAPRLWIAVVVLVVAHLGGGAQWMLSSYGLQRATPDAVRGRIFAFDFGLVTLTGGASFFLCGALAEPFGVRAVIGGAGVTATLFGLAWGRATRRFWDAPAFQRKS
jgi:MFS family permease